MNKMEVIKLALLTAIAIEGALCVSAIRRIAREGFNVELSMEQADSLACSVQDARDAALIDIKED